MNVFNEVYSDIDPTDILNRRFDPVETPIFSHDNYKCDLVEHTSSSQDRFEPVC